MKKIVKHPKGVRLEAIVEKDGIGFIPTKIAGPAAVSFNGCFSTIGEDGKVTCKRLDLESDDEGNEASAKREMDKKIKKYGLWVLSISGILIITSLIMMIVSFNWANVKLWVNVFASIVFLMMFVLVLPKAFAVLIGRIFRKKDMISFSKYLGAKNAVENAFFDLGRVPTMEEVKEYSIYSSEDKYTQSSYIAFIWLIMSFVRLFDGWAFVLGVIASVLVLCLLEWKNKLAFVQALVVSEPDENHYKVAIAALEDVSEVLEHVEIRFHAIEISPDPENFDEELCLKKGCPAFDLCKEESQKIAKNKGENETSK